MSAESHPCRGQAFDTYRAAHEARERLEPHPLAETPYVYICAPGRHYHLALNLRRGHDDGLIFNRRRKAMGDHERDWLLAYSEWLDSEGLVQPERPEDKRSHRELVAAFLARSDPDWGRAG